MRLWSTVLSQLQRPECSPEYSPLYAGADIAVLAKSFLRLLQCSEISDDVGDLLIAEAAVRRRDLRFENRIVFVEAERGHYDVWLHLPRILDPQCQIRGGVRAPASRNRAARPDVRKIRPSYTHRCRIARDRMTSDASGARENLLTPRGISCEPGSELEIARDRRMRDGVL